MPGYGAGKTILCGEHFVVHGEQALVVSLPLRTRVDVVPFDGSFIIDKRPKHPDFVLSKQQLYEGMAEAIANLFGVGKQYSFVLSGDLPVTSGGIGASAAAAVGITRALQEVVGVPLSSDDIMTIALAGERVIHGNPSGIDTTAAANEGILLFQKKESGLFTSSVISASVLCHPGPELDEGRSGVGSNQLELPLLLVDSQKVTTTKETVAEVARFKDQQPAVWEQIIKTYRDILAGQVDALQRGSLEQLGKLFCQNHELLMQLNLSCCHVERVRDFAQQLGALGSKMTGTCRGGLVLVLGRDLEHVMQMARTFDQCGFFTVNTSIESVLNGNVSSVENILF